MSHIRYKLCSVLSIIFCPVLGFLLSRRMKRIIFLTGIYANLVEKGVFHEKTLSKLNCALCLSSTEKALELPPSVYHRIIDQNELSKVLLDIDSTPLIGEGEVCVNYRDAKKVSAELVHLVPSWLRYDNDDLMNKDLISLLHCQPM